MIEKIISEIMEWCQNDKDKLQKLIYKLQGVVCTMEEEEKTRICSHCGKEMDEGYVIDNGSEYYCSDECLHKHISEEEYNELYDDGNGDSYWTQWY